VSPNLALRLAAAGVGTARARLATQTARDLADERAAGTPKVRKLEPVAETSNVICTRAWTNKQAFRRIPDLVGAVRVGYEQVLSIHWRRNVAGARATLKANGRP
jgi:hypothetical protein